MNALKTGIDAKTQLIRGETWTALEELIGEYYGRFHPTTPNQRMLVDTLIDCDWLLRRFRTVETQLWEKAYDIFDVTLGQAYSEKCDEFSRLQRRIDMTQRNYRNALHELQRLQAEEAHDLDPDPTPRNQPVSPPNGFVPQPSCKTPSPPRQPPPRSAWRTLLDETIATSDRSTIPLRGCSRADAVNAPADPSAPFTTSRPPALTLALLRASARMPPCPSEPYAPLTAKKRNS
jgi:hypothetical protein